MNQNAPRKPFPGIAQAIGLLALAVILQVVVAAHIGIIDVVLRTSLGRSPWTLGLMNLVALGLATIVGFGLTRSPWVDVFPLRRLEFRWIVPMTLTVVGLHMLLSELDNWTRFVLPPPEWLVSMFQDLIDPAGNPFSSVWLLVIVAPLSEEFLVRGLILRGFRQRYTVRTAILVSALLFGALHLNPYQFFGGLGLGTVLAWWQIRTHSLSPCLFGHALINALPLLLPRLPLPEIRGYNAISETVEFQPPWFTLTGAVLLVIGNQLVRRQFRFLPLAEPPPDPADRQAAAPPTVSSRDTESSTDRGPV